MRGFTKVGLALLLVSCGMTGETGEPPQMAHAAAPQPIVVVGGGQATWIGALPASGAILATGGETYLGIWVEIPVSEPPIARAPMDVALVVDTSGSMQGAKIQNARAAARTLASSLPDGDILSVLSFSDAAKVVAQPSRLGVETRPRLLSLISELSADGSTNMAAGLQLGQSQMALAPETHPVRRLILISDGQANVGVSQPAALGAIAEQGLRYGAQVTSMGVGNDYDENTLNAIAVRTNGRLYHLPENQEMASVLKRELDLLGGTLGSEAVVEVVPAPGVQILGSDDANLSTVGDGGTLRLPIGTLFRGQRREALVRVRVAAGAGQRPLANVRLQYRGAAGAARVQEVATRAVTTDDPAVVTAQANGRPRAIAAVYEANRLRIQAARQLTGGDAKGAEDRLARAEEQLRREAAAARDAETRQRLASEADEARRQQNTARAAAAAPPPVQRSRALELNAPAASPAGR